MKILLTFLFTISLSTSLMAAEVGGWDESDYAADDEAVFELDAMNSRGWHHIGCVSQVNSASTCRRKAAQHGYSQSRIQQDYQCPPKVFYSCYGRGTGNSELLSEDEALSAGANSSCSYYVKPATCVSHKQCKWVGSCVPR